MATSSRKPRAKGKPAVHRVRIRMYQHGLGDCFLLSFPRKKERDLNVLIDCGVVLGTSNPAAIMSKVATDIRKVVGKELDILIITHEHWDHLSAFDPKQARSIFDPLQIDSLWMAWTEDDNDKLALALRDERERKKEAAKKARELAKKRKLDGQADRVAELLGFFGAAAAGDSSGDSDSGAGTEGALDYLKEKRRPTILQTGTHRPLPGVAGVRVYVMGPSKDSDAIKKTNPYKGEGYGLADMPLGLTDAYLAAFDEKDEHAQPFAHGLRLAPPDGPKVKQLAAEPAGAGLAGYYHPANAWRNIDDAWIATGERLALQLDNATNNTSLVLAFEFEDTRDVLLFVGDAQAGNWRSWEKCKWRVKGSDGEVRRVTAVDLLNRTIFYKVGHHGSHNATLREKGLELMTSGRLAACIPVDTEVAHKVKGWEHMPLPAIRERLEKKCAIVFQSDLPPKVIQDIPGARWKASKETFVPQIREKKTNKVRKLPKRPLYTDLFL